MISINHSGGPFLKMGRGQRGYKPLFALIKQGIAKAGKVIGIVANKKPDEGNKQSLQGQKVKPPLLKYHWTKKASMATKRQQKNKSNEKRNGG